MVDDLFVECKAELMNNNFNSKLKQSKKHFTIISLNKIEESASVVSDNLSSYNDKYEPKITIDHIDRKNIQFPHEDDKNKKNLLKKLIPDISRKHPYNLKIITNVKGELNKNNLTKEFFEPKSPQSCTLTKIIKMQSNNGRKLKRSKSP